MQIKIKDKLFKKIKEHLKELNLKILKLQNNNYHNNLMILLQIFH